MLFRYNEAVIINCHTPLCRANDLNNRIGNIRGPYEYGEVRDCVDRGYKVYVPTLKDTFVLCGEQLSNE